MKEELAVNIEHLNKEFKTYQNVFTDRIKENIFFWNSSKYYSIFKALNDINLEIKKGEVLGLIGPNGAGKTTLLKIMAQISYPTSGNISINGSVIAVLALGIGFNPRFTGRENIIIGACILGMSLKEAKEKERWIIEFSELERFIDQPLRSYSTGMKARLSFAVAAAVSPEILIIDEALATGDAFFVQKSLGRIHSITKTGTTAIFVSHNLMQIQRLCSDRVVLMEKGGIVNDAPAHQVIKQYDDLIYKYREEDARKKRSVIIENSLQDKSFHGNGNIVVDSIQFIDENKEPTNSVKTGSNVKMIINYNSFVKNNDVKLIVHIENYSGIIAYAFQSDKFLDADKKIITEHNLSFKEGKGKVILDFSPLLLTTNKYLFSVTLYDNKSLHDKNSDFLDNTIFRKKHMFELNVYKEMDLNTSLIFEHPIKINHLQ